MSLKAHIIIDLYNPTSCGCANLFQIIVHICFCYCLQMLEDLSELKKSLTAAHEVQQELTAEVSVYVVAAVVVVVVFIIKWISVVRHSKIKNDMGGGKIIERCLSS